MQFSVDKKNKRSGQSRPLTIPEGKPVLTSQFERIYWSLVDNTYDVPSEDAGPLAMLMEHVFKDLKKARKKRQQAEKSLMRAFMKRQARWKKWVRRGGIVVIGSLVGILVWSLWVRWGW